MSVNFNEQFSCVVFNKINLGMFSNTAAAVVVAIANPMPPQPPPLLLLTPCPSPDKSFYFSLASHSLVSFIYLKIQNLLDARTISGF